MVKKSKLLLSTKLSLAELAKENKTQKLKGYQITRISFRGGRRSYYGYKK